MDLKSDKKALSPAIALGTAIALSVAGIAFAETSDTGPAGGPPADDDRYSMSKLENGYLRLDRKTGDLTHCVIDGHDAWKCVILPETKSKRQERLEALQAENSYLKRRQEAMAARLVEVEETLFDLRDQLNATSDGGTKKPIISKEKRKRLNEALDLGEAMVSRFGDMMRGLKEDAEKLGSKLID